MLQKAANLVNEDPSFFPLHRALWNHVEKAEKASLFVSVVVRKWQGRA